MKDLRPATWPTLPSTAPRTLAVAATQHYSAWALTRGGPYGRATSLVAAGAEFEVAARIASAQGKGHVGELAQSAAYGAFSGAAMERFRARPNPIANDPRVDVEVMRGSRRVHAVQMKVGGTAFVRRAVRSGKYDYLVVNQESLPDEAIGDPRVSMRLQHGFVEADPLRADECEGTSTQALTRMLSNEPTLGQLDVARLSLHAGALNGLVNFALTLTTQVGDAILRGIPLVQRVSLSDAWAHAGRACAKTTLQMQILLQRFTAAARRKFSGRLIHRISRSALLAGAIAEVAVETAIDFVNVLRGELTFEDLLRRFGVHVATAGGAVLGTLLMNAVAAALPPPVRLLLMFFGGIAGGALARRASTALLAPAQPSGAASQPFVATPQRA